MKLTLNHHRTFILSVVPKRLISFLTVFALCWGFALDEGTEVLLTDLESQVIVGHGEVKGGELRLRLDEAVGGFFLYVVSPGGDVSAHSGQLNAEGLLAVFDDGELIELSGVLAEQGVSLRLEVGADLSPATGADDTLLEPPSD